MDAALIDAIEGVSGAMNYGTFRSERDGLRLKDIKEWVEFYVALTARLKGADGAVIDNPPRSSDR